MSIQDLGLNKIITRFTISKRLGIGFGLIMAFMIVLTLTGIWSLSNMNNKVIQITSLNNLKINLAQSIQNAFNSMDKRVMGAVITNDETTTKNEKKKIDDERAIFQISIEKLEKLETTKRGKELIENIKQNYPISQAATDKVLELLSGGNLNQAGTMLTGNLAISLMLAESCDQMTNYQQELIAVSAKDAEATYKRAMFLLITIGSAVLIFALFLSSLLARSIIKPLREGVSVAQKITEGDLTTRISITGNDETSQLLKAMGNMVGGLRHIIGEVKTAAAEMASASSHLNESSELMSSGAVEQAGRSSQVATASEEMSQTVLDIAKNTSSIQSSAMDTSKLAKNGEAVVDRSVEKVKTIANTIGESAKLIESLGTRSSQIGEIVNVINDIADQTNLLALNAAIEAARAGEQGRGFAVVADEVRKLAERTSKSTSEIGSMVKSIQDEVHQAVYSMGNITKEVSLGVDLSSQTGKVLHDIVESVDQLHMMVQQIASATEEMAATSEEINRDIETIASVSKETSGSSEDISKASNELAKLSTNLEKVVGGFKI